MIVKTTTMKDRNVSMKLTSLTEWEEKDLLQFLGLLLQVQRSSETPLDIFQVGYRWTKSTYGCLGECAQSTISPFALQTSVLDFIAALSALHMVEDWQLRLLITDVWLREGPSNSEISITLGVYELQENPAVSIDIELPPHILQHLLGGVK